MSIRLFHYTCDHGYEQIVQRKTVISRKAQKAVSPNIDYLAQFSWFTDLDTPHAEALGLTSQILDCDRTEHRFEAHGANIADLIHWTHVRREVPPWIRGVLERAPGAMPMHWWVARQPIAVEYAPMVGAKQ